MRATIFGKAMALDGDKTTTGATCISSIDRVTCGQSQKAALRVGDQTTTCLSANKQVWLLQVRLLLWIMVSLKRLMALLYNVAVRMAQMWLLLVRNPQWAEYLALYHQKINISDNRQRSQIMVMLQAHQLMLNKKITGSVLMLST
nr:hypothetical protein [Providencia stuartii]